MWELELPGAVSPSRLGISPSLHLGREVQFSRSISKNFIINSQTGAWFSQSVSSAAQLCLTLCDPMNRSTPGLPVHHQLPEFTQTHAHWVGDAIQPSHPLSSPSPPAPNPSQHQALFQWVNSSHEVAKVLEFQLQHQSFQWTPRTDLLQDGLAGSPCSPRDSQESSPTQQFKSINFSALGFLHSPTLTSIHDHGLSKANCGPPAHWVGCSQQGWACFLVSSSWRETSGKAKYLWMGLEELRSPHSFYHWCRQPIMGMGQSLLISVLSLKRDN